jgi:signal transduction histidine kinase
VERELARARSRGSAAADAQFTPLGPVVDKLVGLLRRVDRGAELDWTVSVPAGVQLRMDPQDLTEVLGNLMDNARKWAATRVVILARPGPGGLIVSVSDDGPGFPQGETERLVRRGERGSAHVEGSGLGLSIVTGVLESYGGALLIEAVPSGGCTASFAMGGRIEDGHRADPPGKGGRRSADERPA